MCFITGFVSCMEDRCRHLVVELDSSSIVHLLSTNIEAHLSLGNLLVQCRHFLGRVWQVSVQHYFREANQATDGFANITVSGDRGLRVLQHAAAAIVGLRQWDRQGLTTLRVTFSC